MQETLNKKQSEALMLVRNSLMFHGRAPSIRELMDHMGYKSPRSVSLIIDQLVEKGFLRKRPGKGLQLLRDIESNVINARTVKIPLVGNVACGLPILAEENIEAMVSVSTNLIHPGYKYFLLRAQGDSMNRAGINDGDLLLVRQQPAARDGEVVVALIDDEATVKEFWLTKDAVVLRPKSSNKKHHPIILTAEFLIQGVVTATIPNLEKAEHSD